MALTSVHEAAALREVSMHSERPSQCTRWEYAFDALREIPSAMHTQQAAMHFIDGLMTGYLARIRHPAGPSTWRIGFIC